MRLDREMCCEAKQGDVLRGLTGRCIVRFNREMCCEA